MKVIEKKVFLYVCEQGHEHVSEESAVKCNRAHGFKRERSEAWKAEREKFAARNSQLVAAIESGATGAAAGKMFGISGSRALQIYYKELRRRRRENSIESLINDGWTADRISKYLSIPIGWVFEDTTPEDVRRVVYPILPQG